MKTGTRSGLKGSCQIAVVYEDNSIREEAAHFCARMVEEYDFDAEPDVQWWSFGLLGQADQGNDAAGKAAKADLIIFATSAEGDLPRDIKLWIENWLSKRGEREGALVSLIDHGSEDPMAVPPFKQIYLRHIAHRAGMDFLSHAPSTLSNAMPDSLDSFNYRAGCMTSTLDEILHTHPQMSAPPLF